MSDWMVDALASWRGVVRNPDGVDQSREEAALVAGELRERLARDIAAQQAETLAALKYVHPEAASAVNMAFDQALAVVRGVGEAKP